MKATRENPILYIVIPCYNEQEVLPITSKLFLKKITDLVAAGKISDDSRVLFVNDGSRTKPGPSSATWPRATSTTSASARAATAVTRTHF